ncbi:MAG: PilZ domain-containing protein [Syntrophales bacterium]|jgi:hypothetical protein|nr:PilZ domain-containing protein [Syntrophales bacterium]
MEAVISNRQFNEGQSESALPPWMFRHPELMRSMEAAPCLDRQKLTNTLNYMHFRGDPVYAFLSHPEYEENILIEVHPEPCMGKRLACRWARTYTHYNLAYYRLKYMILPCAQSFIVVPVRVATRDSDGFSLELPESSPVVSRRRYPRYGCHDVMAELWQDGFQAVGELVDFSPRAFRLKMESSPEFSFSCFNPEEPATVRLSGRNQVFYSGICRCRREKTDGNPCELVFAPLNDRIKRFRARRLRNPRRPGFPALSVLFEHPFMGKRFQREILDISTTGFSLCEKPDESILMPGMIIPKMSLVYAGILELHCKGQVIYRREEEGQIRFGLTILDMDLTSYSHLNQIINNIHGSDSGMTNLVDPDELWEFFFDTDFIYPQKYGHLESFKKHFQGIYRRLYEETPTIARHFTCQRNGRIYGHIAMLRCYERTWMVHHHAARPIGGRPMGLTVLKQLIYYQKDLNRLPSANMDYVMTYFRPENKFPAKVFGGFAGEHDNPRHCSIDGFAYMTYPAGKALGGLPAGWGLRECSGSDLWEFEQYYRNHHGGLLGSIIMQDPPRHGKPLREVYAENGFVRTWTMHLLTHLNYPKAFIVFEESDMGINLSNLLNGFKIFVMDPDMDPDILFGAISSMAGQKMTGAISLLISPADYVEKTDMKHDHKRYLLWILDMRYANEYIEFLSKRYRIRYD